MRICTKYVLSPALQRTRPQFNGQLLIAMKPVVSNTCHYRKVIMKAKEFLAPAIKMLESNVDFCEISFAAELQGNREIAGK